jgi:hypothetical protein
MYMAPLGCRGVLGQPTGDLAHPCVETICAFQSIHRAVPLVKVCRILWRSRDRNGDVHLIQFIPPLFFFHASRP